MATLPINADELPGPVITELVTRLFLRPFSNTIAARRAVLRRAIRVLNAPLQTELLVTHLAPRRSGWTQRAEQKDWASLPFEIEGARFVWTTNDPKNPEALVRPELFFTEEAEQGKDGAKEEQKTPQARPLRPATPGPIALSPLSPEEDEVVTFERQLGQVHLTVQVNCALAGLKPTADTCPHCHRNLSAARSKAAAL